MNRGLFQYKGVVQYRNYDYKDIRIMETPYMERLSLYWNGHQGLRLNIKMSYQYRDPHVKDNTVSRPSYF